MIKPVLIKCLINKQSIIIYINIIIILKTKSSYIYYNIFIVLRRKQLIRSINDDYNFKYLIFNELLQLNETYNQ